jgi:hypothetical protein
MDNYRVLPTRRAVKPAAPSPTAPAGLCASCTHAIVVTSDRGTQYLRCALSQTDPSFPKYPRLPVLSCRGWTRDSVSGCDAAMS